MFPCQELDLTILPAQDTPWLPPPRWNRWIHPSAWKMPKCLLSLDRINQWKTMLQQLPSDLFCPQKLDCSFLSYETCPGTAQSSAQMLAPVGLGSVQQLTEKFKGIYPNFIPILSGQEVIQGICALWSCHSAMPCFPLPPFFGCLFF